MKILIFISLLSAQFAFAEVNTTKATAAKPQSASSTTVANEVDFDSLGGNEILFEKAKDLQPEKTVSIVQNRTIQKKNRFELAPEYSGVFGGDTYSRTQSLGLNAHFHINYNWSVGAKYNYSFNKLTPEGEARIDQALADYNANPQSPSFAYPELNYQKSEALALVNWYPIYGKFSLFDRSVIHFDFYLVGGYGQIQLSKSSSPTYTAGTGLGFWVSNNFTTRLEMRYQNYNSEYLGISKKMDLAVASVQMGWLL